MSARILIGDCRASMRTLEAAKVQTCVTSPPYFGLRDYGVAGQIGLEPTPDAYVAQLVEVFREVRRALRDDGTLWLNLGDSYATAGTRQGNTGHTFDKYDRRVAGDGYRALTSGLKSKDLIGIPWRVAFALQADGWYLRSDIVWQKPNPMPESVTDRPTKSHEYLFLLAKSDRYYYDAEAVKEPGVSGPSDIRKMQERALRIGGKTLDADDPKYSANASTNIGKRRAVGTAGSRNRRSVWTIATAPFKGAHFATFPPKLVEPCILAGSRPGDTVLDPFGGAGTTGLVAARLGREAILCELNPAYAAMASDRIGAESPLFAQVAT